ncbi:transmembrane transport protein [Salmonella bongori]|nr:transmembrane transport protein [Salmonella bongori]
MTKPTQGLSPALIVLMSVATGLAVASNYYVQPLLDTIAASIFTFRQRRRVYRYRPRNWAMPLACYFWCRSATCLNAERLSSP